MQFRKFRHLVSSLVIVSVIGVGCDSGVEETQTIALSGSVTDNDGYGKAAGPVVDATIEAEAYSSTGSASNLEGSAITSATGSYMLDVESSAQIFVVKATGDSSFRSSAIASRAEGATSITAMPMTTESYGEAEVFEASRESGKNTSYADIVLAVDADLAAELRAGTVTSAAVASVIYDESETEDAYTEESGEPDERRRTRDDNRATAFLNLQAALASAADNSSQQATAMSSFVDAFVSASVDAGMSAETQAKAAIAARMSADASADDATLTTSARLSLQKRAAVKAAMATSMAVEAAFEAYGSNSETIAGLRTAGTQYVSAVASASSRAAIDVAAASYNASVEATLSVEAQVSQVAITAAKSTADAAETVLDAALAVATSASARAEAYATFFTSVDAAFETSFGASANASFGASILTLLVLQ